MSEILLAIGALHDGVADPDLWLAALDRVTALVGTSTLMFGHRVTETQRLVLEGHRVPEAAIALMAEPLGNAAANPYIAALPRLPLREPVDHETLGGQAAIEASRLWREVMQPFELAWSMAAVLERQVDVTDFVVFGRPASRGRFDTVEKDRLRLLLPHLARAYRVRRELEFLRGLAADCMEALDHLDRGVVLLAQDGSVKFANRSAEAVFRDNDGLRASSTGLRTPRPRQDLTLRRMVREAAETGAGRGDSAVRGMMARRPSGETPYTLVAEPLAPAHRERLGAPAESGAIVFIGGYPGRAPAARRLRALYGLTPAEAGVAARIATGRRIPEIAEETAISVNTVKTHLKRIYAKVGVDRASRLTARIAADLGGLLD